MCDIKLNYNLSLSVLSSRDKKYNILDKYEIRLGELLGKGSYSYVFKIESTDYVIKLMKPNYRRSDKKAIQNKHKLIENCVHYYNDENYREIDIVKKLIGCKKYPSNLVYIVCYGMLKRYFIYKETKCYFPKRTFFIIEKYYDNFNKIYNDNISQKLSSIQIIKFIFDIKQAFKQLLNLTRYIHLDPKLSNIYISDDRTKFLLSDFNLVQTYYSDKDVFKPYEELYYLHPVKSCKLNTLPFYSLGITLLEIHCDKKDVFNLDNIHGITHEDYLKKLLIKYKDKIEPAMHKYINKCLNFECFIKI